MSPQMSSTQWGASYWSFWVPQRSCQVPHQLRAFHISPSGFTSWSPVPAFQPGLGSLHTRSLFPKDLSSLTTNMHELTMTLTDPFLSSPLTWHCGSNSTSSLSNTTFAVQWGERLQLFFAMRGNSVPPPHHKHGEQSSAKLRSKHGPAQKLSWAVHTAQGQGSYSDSS